jgi:hypothetical protein
MSADDRRDVRVFLYFVALGLLVLVGLLTVRNPWQAGRWSSLAAVGATGQAVGVFAALIFAAGQLRESRTAARIDRTLALHVEYTEGDIGASRHRLSSFLYEEAHRRGLSDERTVQPRHLELRAGGSMRFYRARDEQERDPSVHTVVRDVHNMMWFFQRVGSALDHGVIDEALLYSLFGYHAVRWECTFMHFNRDDAEIRAGLEDVASWACSRADSETKARWLERVERMHEELPARIVALLR